jgi:hypothetical protein
MIVPARRGQIAAECESLKGESLYVGGAWHGSVALWVLCSCTVN